ncbi:retrovirus-related pol polyprotein from transposon TNT 1-94 [Tanacetum coccineum]
MQQPMLNIEDISDPTTTMNTTLVLIAKAFKLSTTTNNNQRTSSNPRNRQIAQPGMNMGQDRQIQIVRGNGGNQFRQQAGQNVGNQNGYNALQNVGNQNPNGNGNVVATRAEGNAIGNNAGDLDEIEEVNENCILMANSQQSSTSGTHTNKAPIYESDGSAEVQLYDNCCNNYIFNMFTQEEQYTELLEPIPKPHQVQQNDSNVISEVSSVEQDRGTIEQHPTTVEETHAYFESLYNNLAIKVEKVNSVNRKMIETNADLTTKLARYKNQEKCFETNQEKYDKLERCYQKSIYQEQCLTKKIKALHLSSGKQIMYLNEEIANLNNRLSKEKSIVSFLQEEKKKLKSDFNNREDELLDKQIQLENKINELDNILVKTGQSIQTMHMLSPKPDSFYHTEHKMVLGYQNPFYLKQAHKKQQGLYNGKVLLEKHDPPDVYDSEETLQLAQEKATKFVRDFKSLAKEADESLAKHKALELEIEHLLRAVVIQDIMSIVQTYNDMQQKIELLQAQLGDIKGKSKDTPCVSDTLDPLFQKLKNENVELEFQIKNYAKENAYLKSSYKNLFDSINDTTKGTSANTKFANQSTSGTKLYPVTPFPKSKIIPKVVETNDLSKPVTLNWVPTLTESKVMTNNKVISPRMFRINPFKTSKEDKFVPINKIKASVRTNPTTISQPHVITKKDVNSDSNCFSSTGVNITAKTRRPQPRSNTKNDRVPSASKSSCIKNKEVEVEEHHRNLLLSTNKKHISSLCNNVKLAIRNDKSEVVCAMCKQCLITANHDVCVLNYVNDMNSRVKKQKENVSYTENQKKQKPEVKKPKKVGFKERLASPTPSEPSISRRNLLANGFQIPLLFSAGTVRFGNDHVAAILGYDLEVAFRRNIGFIRNLKGFDLLKGNRTTNLYTINLHEMSLHIQFASWLVHGYDINNLSHLNFDIINDLAKNDLATGLLKFKYHKEHLCPSCEQGKSKRASHPPKPVTNSKQRLHLLHMDLCGPMRVESINGKRCGLVIVDDYSLYTWVHFLRSKDEAPEQLLLRATIIHHRFGKTPYELINGRKPDISFLYVFGALCYSKNDRDDIGKLGAKGDIGFFIAMAFEQSSLKLGLQSMTSRQISSGLTLPYAPVQL